MHLRRIAASLLVVAALVASAGIARAQDASKGDKKPAAPESAKKNAHTKLRWTQVSPSCYVAERGAGKSNAGVIVGADSVLVVDCLDSPAAAKELLEGIARLTKTPVRRAVLTHSHYDHCVGDQALPANVSIVSSEAAAGRLARRLKNDRLLLSPGGGGVHMSITIAKVRLPDVTFRDRKEIDLGGVKVILAAMGDCHSTGDVVVYVPAEKVLFAGDLAWGKSHPNLSGGSTFRWISTLARLEKLDVEHVVPGHGEPGGKELLADQRHYLMEVRRLVKHLARKEVTPEKIRAGLPIPEVYAKYANAGWWPKNVVFVYSELVQNR